MNIKNLYNFSYKFVTILHVLHQHSPNINFCKLESAQKQLVTTLSIYKNRLEYFLVNITDLNQLN